MIIINLKADGGYARGNVNEEETGTGAQNMAIKSEEGSDGIQLEEVKKAVRKLKNWKAPGVNGLKAELLKNPGKNLNDPAT